MPDEVRVFLHESGRIRVTPIGLFVHSWDVLKIREDIRMPGKVLESLRREDIFFQRGRLSHSPLFFFLFSATPLFFLYIWGTRSTKLLEISTHARTHARTHCKMVYEAAKQSMAWMETDYSKHTHFQWKIKWRLEHLGSLGIMGEMVPSIYKRCSPTREDIYYRAFTVPHHCKDSFYNTFIIHLSCRPSFLGTLVFLYARRPKQPHQPEVK